MHATHLPPATDPRAAADGWVEKRSADGVPYYHNGVTGEVSWDCPPSLQSGAETVPDNGDWMWVSDEKLGYVAAQWLSDGPNGTSVKLENGMRLTVPPNAKIAPLKRSALTRIEQDLVMMDSHDDAMVLHTLRCRFAEDSFYTSIGTILVAINPYRYLPLYTPAIVAQYHRPGNRQLSPHVYQIAAAAHNSLLLDNADQAVLISGESGAGKTEATKHCLGFLAEVGGSEHGVESQVLQANPLLEGFGNAKTLRNNNSSRFGKWIELHLDPSGAVISARIEPYLLEKSRVPSQQAGERSYHIFYQLLASKYVDELQLHPPEHYEFLSASKCYSVPGMNEEADFNQLLAAFTGLGFSPSEVDEVMHLVAGVLCLGNLHFEQDGGEGCRCVEPHAVRDLARLWHSSEPLVTKAVTVRTIEVRGTSTEIPLKPAEAPDVCAAFAKTVYDQLFNCLVKRINTALEGSRGRFVGILDIFGFEIFETNSFEQMCINYANEKLQQLFNQHTFKQEEQLYQAEGIDHEHVVFIDNQPVLNLIEGKPKGILAMLDDEVVVGKSGDEGFVANLDRCSSGSQLLRVFKPAEARKTGVPMGFTILHYAGEVRYTATGFLDKNKDPVSADLAALFYEASSALSDLLFPKPKGFRRAPTTRSTIGSQFKSQLGKLMDVLRQCEPHFVRCIKPNQIKRPREFSAPMVLEQLRYSGIFEAVAIRRSGFPFRHRLERFVHLFKCLLLDHSQPRRFALAPFASRDLVQRAQQILAATRQDFSGVRFGNTMIFYRAKEQRVLDLLRNLALERLVPFLQRVTRGTLAREFRRRCKRSAASLGRAVAHARSAGTEGIDDLEAAIACHAELLGTLVAMFACEIDEAMQAKRLRRELQQLLALEEEVAALLRQDIDESYDQLIAAVERLETLSTISHTPRQQQLKANARELLDRNAARRLGPEAEEALWVLDKGRMEAVAAESERLHFCNPEIEHIRVLLALPEEKFVELQLKKAVELNDPVRVINREVRLKEIYLRKNASMFTPENFSKLRAPMEFACARFLDSVIRSKRQELASGMLFYSSRPLHTSLTELEPALAKEATQLFKCLLAFSGERPSPYPPAMALQVLQAGGTVPELRGEIYMQIMKQLRSNPSQESAKRYWELLALALMSFAPGPGCDDIVNVFCRQNAEDEGQKFISLLHTVTYDGGQPVPTAEEIPTLISGFFARNVRSRFSVAEAAGSVTVPTIDRRASEKLNAAAAPQRSVQQQSASEPVPEPASAPQLSPKPSGALRFVAKVDCHSPSPSLQFRKGDIITITTQREDGWWLGELNGQIGWVYNTYVAPASE